MKVVVQVSDYENMKYVVDRTCLTIPNQNGVLMMEVYLQTINHTNLV